MNEALITEFIATTAKSAGDILLAHARTPLERFAKGTDGDFATNADLAAQTHIVEAIQAHFPLDGIIAEEEHCAVPSRSGYTWIVDPLDGTRNYVAGNDQYGVMIAYANEDTLLHSAIYFPADAILFSASRSRGAYKNGVRIELSFPQSVREVRACIAHTDPRAETTPALDALRSQLPTTGFAPCTLFSSAANTRSILEGDHDAFIIPSNCVWDNCAPALLLNEAGLSVSDWYMRDIHPRFGTQHFLSAPPTVHEHIQQTLIAFLPEHT